jgi:hypothetical protein
VAYVHHCPALPLIRQIYLNGFHTPGISLLDESDTGQRNVVVLDSVESQNRWRFAVTFGRDLLLWIVGVPLPIILLLIVLWPS